jgi:CBS domain-containing protein
MKPIEVSSCCTPQDSAATAAQAMRESNCGCAPVVENKQKLNLVGVVTERDICHSVAADNKLASEVHVEEIMRPAASACCGAVESVEEARRKLNEHQATSLPVVNKAGSCCGTISLHQIQKT